MKDSQPRRDARRGLNKCTKVNNERLSIRSVASVGHKNSKQLLKDS